MRAHLIQMDIAWNDKPANFKKATEMLDSVLLSPFDLVVFPEMFATGFMAFPKEGVAEDFDDEASPTVQFLKGIAQAKNVWVQGGGISSLAYSLYNHTIIFSPRGDVFSYDKIRLFPSERRRLSPGKSIEVLAWEEFSFAPFTCYDLRFPELFREAARRGAEVFSVIASWPKERQAHFETLLSARAIENQAFVLGVNRVGKDPYAHYAGGSRILSPKGEILACAGDEETIVSSEISREALLSWRKEFSALRDAFEI